MNIDSTHSSDGSLVLKIAGGLTFAAQKKVQEAIHDAQNLGVTSIVLDLEQVPFIDNAGLALIMIAHQKLKEDNIQLSLSHPQDYVQKALDLANVHSIVSIL